jgi:hypothetical protein
MRTGPSRIESVDVQLSHRCQLRVKLRSRVAFGESPLVSQQRTCGKALSAGAAAGPPVHELTRVAMIFLSGHFRARGQRGKKRDAALDGPFGQILRWGCPRRLRGCRRGINQIRQQNPTRNQAECVAAYRHGYSLELSVNPVLPSYRLISLTRNRRAALHHRDRPPNIRRFPSDKMVSPPFFMSTMV